MSSRVTKIQSDTQLRFSDLENDSVSTKKNDQVNLPGTSKPQDFGANPGYKTTNLPAEQTINSVESAQTVITEQPEKVFITRQACFRTVWICCKFYEDRRLWNSRICFNLLKTKTMIVEAQCGMRL